MTGNKMAGEQPEQKEQTKSSNGSGSKIGSPCTGGMASQTQKHSSMTGKA